MLLSSSGSCQLKEFFWFIIDPVVSFIGRGL
jgi:hypothetical protein